MTAPAGHRYFTALEFNGVCVTCGFPESAHLPLREREGDQPLPTDGQQNVSEAVKADLDERIALGIKRYGKPLQTFNGRDALRDAYEEALDLVHYLKQAILERDAWSAKKYDTQ